MLVLGIETSCDETAAAVVSGDKRILSNVIHSQIAAHQPYGGVVPEIASRAHIAYLQPVIEQALKEANVSFAELDAVATTGGPGLIGGVIVGVMMGKTIASVHNKPFIAVNHLEGHALTARLTDEVEFPYLLLLVSGGHCQFLIAHGVGHYTRLGGTVDDALGEAFDKVAKMLGLPYPGGPAVEKLAREGDAHAFDFPVPMKGRAGCDFSFSGLKTAVRQIQGNPADICASFQRAAAESVIDRTRHAIAMFEGKTLVVAGGVAANQYIKQSLQKLCDENGLRLVTPPVKLCTDNAAMIAWAGVERLKANKLDTLDFEPRARWPLAVC